MTRLAAAANMRQPPVVAPTFTMSLLLLQLGATRCRRRDALTAIGTRSHAGPPNTNRTSWPIHKGSRSIALSCWHLALTVASLVPGHPDLRNLRAFVAVAEELHFTRAAQRVHLTQQALSLQIRQLEASLGVAAVRRGRPAGSSSPTAGRTMLAHAVALLGLRRPRVGGRRAVGGPQEEQHVLALLLAHRAARAAAGAARGVRAPAPRRRRQLVRGVVGRLGDARRRAHRRRDHPLVTDRRTRASSPVPILQSPLGLVLGAGPSARPVRHRAA